MNTIIISFFVACSTWSVFSDRVTYSNFLLQRTYGRPKTYRQATHNFDCSKFAWKQLEWTSSLQQSVTTTCLRWGTTPARNSPQLMQVRWARRMHSFVATWYRYLRNWWTSFMRLNYPGWQSNLLPTRSKYDDIRSIMLAGKT